jgi:regulator of sigma E protease
MTPTLEHPDLLARTVAWAVSLPGGATVMTALLFIIVLSILVFVHEYGHFWAARRAGIRVRVFSIGFGTALLKWHDQHGTQWQVGWIPLGGYVEMLGQVDGAAVVARSEQDAYPNKTIGQRAGVIAAGPLANLLFAFVLLVLVMLTGEHKLKAEVGATVPDQPAHGVLLPGDLIVALNGQPVREWQDVPEVVSDQAGQTVLVTVSRAGAALTVPLVPLKTTFTDLLGDTHTVGRLGIAPSYGTFVVHHGPMEALLRAGERWWELLSMTVKSLYKLIIGAISVDNLTGPLGIADLTGQTAAQGVFTLLMFMVVISINLGLVNLLPLPVLDGGHLVLLALEKLRGKALGARAQEWLFKAGFALIIGLALLATTNDLRRLGLFGPPEAEAGGVQQNGSSVAPVQP